MIAAPTSAQPEVALSRSVVATLVVVGAALVIAAAVGLPLVWDGGWFALRAIDEGTPTYLYGRYVGAIIQAPALLVRNLSGELGPVLAAFNAAYAAVPLVALGGSWVVVRRDRPGLIVWPVLAICVVTLPGQSFFIAEGNVAAQLAWPVVLAAGLGSVRRHAWLVLPLAALVAVAHVFGVVLLGAAGGAAALRVARRGAPTVDWARAALAAAPWVVLAGAVAVRHLLLRTPYEEASTSAAWLATTFDNAVAGVPLAAVVLGWASAVLLARRSADRTVGALAAPAAGMAGLVLIAWAADPRAWVHASQFRAWALFLVLPILLLATWEATSSRPERATPARSWTILAAGLAFGIVLTVQSGSWGGLLGRLTADLSQPGPACTPSVSLDWVARTPLDHWALASHAVLVQGRDPGRLLLPGDECASAPAADRIPIKATAFDLDERPVGGWFGWEAVLTRWRDEAPAARATPRRARRAPLRTPRRS